MVQCVTDTVLISIKMLELFALLSEKCMGKCDFHKLTGSPSRQRPVCILPSVCSTASPLPFPGNEATLPPHLHIIFLSVTL